MKSTFDNNEFLQSEIDPGGRPLDTKTPLCPECETLGQICALTPRVTTNADGREVPVVEVMWAVMDARIKDEVGIDDLRVRQTLWLDAPPGWSPSQGFAVDLGPHKSRDLGRLLEGLGLNDGSKFRWSKLMHQEGWLKVVPPKNPDLAPFSDVKMVASSRANLTRK